MKNVILVIRKEREETRSIVEEYENVQAALRAVLAYDPKKIVEVKLYQGELVTW